MMKRINKIKISGKYLKTKWYVKLVIAGLALILISMIAVLLKFYFDVNKESDSIIPDGNIISDFDNVKNNYIIFRNDEGLYGVKDTNNRYIIEPQWNNIFFLNNERFAVEQKDGDLSSIGIIDSEENLITPFVFEKISPIGKDFIAAYFNDKSGFALLDTEGNIISDKIWKSFEYNEQNETVKLTDETGTYGYKYENNILICTDLKFMAKIDKSNVVFLSEDEKMIENISSDKMYKIFDSACIYFSALISGKTDGISSVTDERFSETLLANNPFKNCKIKNVKNLTINLPDDRSEGYIFSAEIIYDYHDEEKTVENLKSLISLNFIDNEEHIVVLNSVNKKDF